MPSSVPPAGEHPRWALLSLLLLLSSVVSASQATDFPLSSQAPTSGEAGATSRSLLTQWEAPQGLARAAAAVCHSRVCLGWYLPLFVFLQQIFCSFNSSCLLPRNKTLSSASPTAVSLPTGPCVGAIELCAHGFRVDQSREYTFSFLH